MADTTTPNYGLTKPEVGASEDTWGTKINTNLNLIDTQMKVSDTRSAASLPKAGGAMTGAITTNSTFDGRDVAADGVTADAALPKAGGTMTGVIAGFESTGIDDNATSTAITIDASEDIEAGTYSSSGATNGIKFNLSSNTGRINISSINSTSDMLNFNTTNGEVGSIQAVGSGTIYSTGGTGGGIKLGGTGAANTLDDYEEGSYNPVVQGSTSAGSFSPASNHGGRYTKIGNLVSLHFEITGTLSSAVGTYSTMPLPFVVQAGTTASVQFSYVTTPNLNHIDISVYCPSSASFGYFIIKTSSTGNPIYPNISSFMPSAIDIYGSVTYTTT
jgi:hypothetical protein